MFLKMNRNALAQEMFHAEMHGLAALRAAVPETMVVPKPLTTGALEKPLQGAFLCIEAIDGLRQAHVPLDVGAKPQEELR